MPLAPAVDITETTGRLFSDRLQKFHFALMEYDWSNIPNCLFIRDFDNLPNKAHNDIDLMADESEFPKLIELFEEESQNNELVMVYKRAPGKLFILLFDLYRTENRRCWSYYEVRKDLPFNNGSISARDIGCSTEFQLPVPIKKWHFALYFHQGLRKNNIKKYQSLLSEMIVDDETVTDVFCERFGMNRDDIFSLIKDPTDLGDWHNKLGIRPTPEKVEPALSLLTVWKRALTRKFYIWHSSGPIFFTIHGPDGVGKSTTIEEVSKILNEYPFKHEVFHHIQGWKRQVTQEQEQKKQNVDKKQLKNGDGVSLLRGMLRKIYRSMPSGLKQVWLFTSNYIKYSKNLNNLILDKFDEHNIIICDRYIYDSWAKERVTPDYLKILHPLHFVFCKALRPPTLAFVITDDPQKIYMRKQELTPTQISNYQEIMSNIVHSLGLMTHEIHVNSRMPEDLAREIARKIIETSSASVFNLMGENVRQENESASAESER